MKSHPTAPQTTTVAAELVTAEHRTHTPKLPPQWLYVVTVRQDGELYQLLTMGGSAERLSAVRGFALGAAVRFGWTYVEPAADAVWCAYHGHYCSSAEAFDHARWLRDSETLRRAS